MPTGPQNQCIESSNHPSPILGIMEPTVRIGDVSFIVLILTVVAWIYQMVSGAKDSVENLTSSGQLPSTASSPWAQSTADNAITRLDTALVHLADPSPRPGSPLPDDPKPTILPSDIKRFIDSKIALPWKIATLTFSSVPRCCTTAFDHLRCVYNSCRPRIPQSDAIYH